MLGQKVFTTGEAARICSVSQQTIIRNFDAGRLKGFRIPGSSFRRIPRQELINFCQAYDLPMVGLPAENQPTVFPVPTAEVAEESPVKLPSSAILTVGQVARICNVAPRTVCKWFDSGRLRGYRIPGDNTDRRIPRGCLIKFLKEHGMPYHRDLEDKALARVLIVTCDEWLIDRLKRELLGDQSYRIAVAASGFTAGMQAGNAHPDCIVVDFSIGQAEAQPLCQNLRRHPTLADSILVALSPADTASVDIDCPAMDEVFIKPFDPVLLAECLRTLISIKKQKV